MEVRRATYSAAIRLAIALSALAAIVAAGLEAIGDVSRTSLVMCVIVGGFVASWVQTGRAEQAARHRSHRLAIIPLERQLG